MLSYTSLLTSAPGITPNLLSGLVNARVYTDKNMTKADAREIMDSCREVYAERQQRGLVEDSNGAAATSAATAAAAAAANARMARSLTAREAAFRAALNAARKRPAGRSGSATSSPAKT